MIKKKFSGTILIREAEVARIHQDIEHLQESDHFQERDIITEAIMNILGKNYSTISTYSFLVIFTATNVKIKTAVSAHLEATGQDLTTDFTVIEIEENLRENDALLHLFPRRSTDKYHIRSFTG